MIDKRRMLIGLSLVLVLIVALPAYSTALERPKNVELKLVGFIVGTSLHFRAELIAEALRKEYPDWNVRAISTPKGPRSVFEHRRNKTAQFFVSLTPRPQEIEVWTPIYKKQGIDFVKDFNWFGVIPLATKYVHCIVPKKTGLNGIKDIADKKYPVKVGMTRPIHDGLFRRCTEFYGATFKDIEGWGGKLISVSFGAPEGPEAMRQGRIDMGFAWAGIPNPPFVQAAADLDLRLLPVAPEAELLKKTEEIGYFRATIRANIYPFNKEDVTTVAQTEWLAFIPDTLPENVLYYVTKGLWNQKDFLIGSLPEFATVLNPGYITTAVSQLGNPVHPGSVKFYREQGWIK